MTDSQAPSDFRAAGSALIELSEDQGALNTLLSAISERDPKGFRSGLSQILPLREPNFSYTCRVISGAAFLRLPDLTKEVCWWNVGPNSGQLYEQAETVTVSGQQVQAPDWLKQYLVEIGAITCAHPIIRELVDFWSATCEPDY